MSKAPLKNCELNKSVDAGLRQHDDGLLSEYQFRAQREGLLPVKVTPFYQKKIDEEVRVLGGTHGPLYRAMYPVAEKLDVHVPGEVADWVDDRANMPAAAKGVFIQKYPDRVLFTPTSTCAAHCLYCFRQDVLSEAHENVQLPIKEQVALLTAHLQKHPEVTEVIFSGGDPLTLSAHDLEYALDEVSRVETVKHIRMHSRAPVFAPQVLKDNKLELLARYNVRFFFHFIHPYEICEEMEALIGRMKKAGIRLYNHFPLLRKVNDHVDVLLSLLEKLEGLGVRTVSIYVPEPIHYSAAYRIAYDRMGRLMDEVTARSPSWLHAFRFCLDSPHGKVKREHLVMRDREKNLLVFARGDKKIIYPDFPETLDEAGDRATLLWRG